MWDMGKEDKNLCAQLNQGIEMDGENTIGGGGVEKKEEETVDFINKIVTFTNLFYWNNFRVIMKITKLVILSNSTEKNTLNNKEIFFYV